MTTPTTTAAGPVGPGLGDLAAADRVPRRVVVPVVRPPLSLCKPTGVTSGPDSRVLVMCDRGGVGKALARRLEKLGCEVLLVEEAPPAEALVRQIEQWTAEKPIQGVYWLPALDVEGELATLTLDDWREALRVRVKLLYATMRALARQVGAAGTFLVSATRLGGQHGYDERGAIAPLGGAVTGFTKAWKREQPDALVKAVDFEASRKTAEFADLLVEETERDPGVVEVGYKDGLRFSVGLAERDAADGRPGMALGRESVFLVTGAAGAIVSAITADLAAASGGTFHLFDLVPEPDRANPDLARFHTDKDGLKRDIFERIKARGERATPAMVEKELMALERAGAALRALDARRARGWASLLVRLRSARRSGSGESLRDRQGAQPPGGRAPPRGRPRDQPLPEGQGAARVRPRLRREGRRLVQRAQGPRRHPDRGHRGLQLDRGALRQRRTDRLQRGQRPPVQDDVELPHHAARDPRPRHRLDGLGRHRHGQPRLDPAR